MFFQAGGILLLFASFVILSPCPAEAFLEKAAGAIVETMVSVYGGPEVLEGMNSVYAKGSITADMRKDSGTYERYFKRDRKLKVETKYGRSTEIRVLNGDTGLRGEREGALVKVAGSRYLSMLYQYKYLDLPYGLYKGLYDVMIVAKKRVDGVVVYVLHITDATGPPMLVHIGANDGLVHKVTGYFTVNNTRTSLSAEFSDFRKTGETVLPYRILNFGGDTKIGETLIEEYGINIEMPDSLFDDGTAP
jgi:hypothetical protein